VSKLKATVYKTTQTHAIPLRFRIINIQTKTVNTTEFLVFIKLHVLTHVGYLQAKILYKIHVNCLYVFHTIFYPEDNPRGSKHVALTNTKNLGVLTVSVFIFTVHYAMPS
jgi:hypothetical protein